MNNESKYDKLSAKLIETTEEAFTHYRKGEDAGTLVIFPLDHQADYLSMSIVINSAGYQLTNKSRATGGADWFHCVEDVDSIIRIVLFLKSAADKAMSDDDFDFHAAAEDFDDKVLLTIAGKTWAEVEHLSWSETQLLYPWAHQVVFEEPAPELTAP